MKLSAYQLLMRKHRAYSACCCWCVQLGFFSIVGMPLFKAMTDLFDGCQPLLDGVLANFRAWEKAAEVTDVSK